MRGGQRVSTGARVFSWLRRWAGELAWVSGALGLVSLAGLGAGAGAAHELFVYAVALALVFPPSRRRAAMLLGRRARKRRWREALAGVADGRAAPALVGYKEDALGSWAAVRTGLGGALSDLEARSEALAAWLGAYDVRFERHPSHAGVAVLRALRFDPLEAGTAPWPWLAKASTDLWEPVPVGVDENGREVALSLPWHNLLVGGEPGAGKSVALCQVVAAAALDPSARLWLLDGKLVELAAWAGTAEGTAGSDICEANDVLCRVQEEMEARYRELLAGGLRKVPPGTALHVVVVDELAHYSTWPDKRTRERFCDLLRDLVSRGRAAGVVVVAATQKPGSEVVPTSLRDLFGYRWALRCTTPAASDTILGSGWASEKVSSHTVAAHQRGVGWLHHESARPVRLRAHYLSDPEVASLAKRAEALRSGRQG